MCNNISIKRALLSVSNKAGIVDFASLLHSLNIEIISTGGTAKTIEDAGIPVTPIDAVTGFPEMLDGRVKTLHPMVHAGLLGIRTNLAHVESMEEHGIEPIDLVCIDLYPFEETIKQDGISFADAIEQIDIGGPSMIRSAAKNFEFVTVITNTQQYKEVIEELTLLQGATSLEMRKRLSQRAFARTAAYDEAINRWMHQEQEQYVIKGVLKSSLRYGENPNQEAAVFQTNDTTSANVIDAKVIAGKPLSYNNYIDAAAALELVQDLKQQTKLPSVSIIKHANPCGAAVAENQIDAFLNAWAADTLASFGSIVASSEPIDIDFASCISEGEKFIEVVVAPKFTQNAAQILSNRWKNIRLLEVGSHERQDSWTQFKSIEGGFLTQTCSPMSADPSTWEHIAGPLAPDSMLQDASIAWIACGHLKSNSISIVSQSTLIGGGMGQVDRVSAVRLAIQRSGDALKNAQNPVAGSDAFFPFKDAPELLIDAGIRCIVQPGGSLRDAETIELCNSLEVTLFHTGMRCFRH